MRIRVFRFFTILFFILSGILLLVPARSVSAASANYTLSVKFSANGGTINTDSSALTQYRLAGNRVQISRDRGKTWKNVLMKISSSDTYKDLINVSTFGIVKKGYHTVSVSEYNTAPDGSGIPVSRCNTALNSTNPATAKRLNGGKKLTADKTMILYVNWIPNTYTVHFDPNGGTGEMPDQIFTYGVKQASLANAFVRDGYRFLGWTTAKDGSSTLYPDKKAFTKLSSVNGKTVTLYANWEKIPVLSVNCEESSVTFQVNVNGKKVYTGEAPFSTELSKGDTWSVTDLQSTDPHILIESDPSEGTAGTEEETVSILFTRTECDENGPVKVLTPATDDTEGEGVSTCSICGRDQNPVVFPAHNLFDPSVEFSTDAGIYAEDSFDLSVSSPSELPVFYTTDGSLPNGDSFCAADGIISLTDADTNAALIPKLQKELIGDGIVKINPSLPTATVIRAAVQFPDGTFGPAVTKTYILNNDIANFNCAVISLTADPVDLFDYNAGIMAKGAIYEQNALANEKAIAAGEYWKVIANYTMRGWECPAYFELFDSTNALSCEAGCGLQIEGGNARSYAQKSFNVFFRPEYGSDGLSWPVFADAHPGFNANDIGWFGSLSIRAGGNDTEYLKFRDLMFQQMASAHTGFAVQAGKPAVLFLNGEYYGSFILNERFSQQFIETHYGVEADNVVLFEDGYLEEGLPEDDILYQIMAGYAEQDLTVPEIWESFQNTVDIESMADYFATEIYIGNADWNETRNCRVWRAREDDGTAYGDGKWRYILYDTEYSAGLYSQAKTGPSFDHYHRALERSPLFAAAMKNSEFAALFHEKLSQAAETFSYSQVVPVLSEYVSDWTPRVLEGYKRFNDYSQKLPEDREWIRNFFQIRQEYILDYAN